MKKLDKKFYQILVLIIFLTAAGQMTNTIYVPAINQMSIVFNTSIERMQIVIACYLFPYGLLQFVYGPYSDRFGRRPMVLIGVIFFIIGSLLATISETFSTIIIASILQGGGIAVAGVMVRTVMRDIYSGIMLHHANGIMASVLILAPILAPIIGGILSDLYNWRAIFFFLSIYGIFLLFIQWSLFKETNLRKSSGNNVLKQYKQVFTNLDFITILLILVCSNGGLAIFEITSGIIFTSILMLSPTLASILFVTPLPFYMFGSMLSAQLSSYYTLDKIILLGCISLFISNIIMIILYIILGTTVISILIPGCIAFLSCGIILPTATTKAIEAFPNIAGTAGAVVGGTQNLCAGILTALISFIPIKNQVPLSIIMLLLSILCLGTLVIINKFLKNKQIY